MPVLFASILFVACGTVDTVEVTPPPPAPTYTGPAFLRGTVGSMTRFRNNHPLLVSGYGLVVNLEGTGSSEVPAFLRQHMINYAKKMGLGNARLGMQHMTPERVLMDVNTAMVSVQGFIPPGARESTTFDVVISALPQTQTVSLAGGQLWTTELSIDGLNPSMLYTRKLAEAAGSVFINPFDPTDKPEAIQDFQRRAIVVAGGKVKETRIVELVLNQASWQRSRLISDRINERYPSEPGSRFKTAEPVTDLVIRLNIPRRYSDQTQAFLDLVSHLYVQRSPDFEPFQAERLAERLAEDPEVTYDVILAWKSLGKTVIPVLRRFYDDSRMNLRLAALEAGAWLGDELTSQKLFDVASHPEAGVRLRAAVSLVNLPRSPKASSVLVMLLDDDDIRVRLAAYESLSQINDPIIERLPILDDQGEIKFIVDRVPVESPLVYITQASIPRLVIFNPQLGFLRPTLARLWDNHLMLRVGADDGPMELFYQPPQDVEGRTYHLNPTLATLIFFLAHHPTMDQPQEGLALSYSQVVDAVYQLCRSGHVPAPVELRVSPLMELVSQSRPTIDPTPSVPVRPETGSPMTEEVDESDQTGE